VAQSRRGAVALASKIIVAGGTATNVGSRKDVSCGGREGAEAEAEGVRGAAVNRCGRRGSGAVENSGCSWHKWEGRSLAEPGLVGGGHCALVCWEVGSGQRRARSGSTVTDGVHLTSIHSHT
jgi:hypothetical protein